MYANSDFHGARFRIKIKRFGVSNYGPRETNDISLTAV